MQNTFQKLNDVNPMIDDLSHSSLGKMIQKAKWLLGLDRFLQTILPTEFSSYCHVMNVNQSILILGVSSAAIATRIRFISSNLIQALQKNATYQNVREIQCKVCAKTIQF